MSAKADDESMYNRETTWDWPDFHNDPTQENLGQITRWSLNQAPDWTYPPLAIANQYRDRHTKEIKKERYRLILVRGYELDWMRKGLLREIREGLAQGHQWIPTQDLPFTEIVLYAYAADCTPYPTYVLLPSGLYKASTGVKVPQDGPTREIIPLPGIYFFDGWRTHPTLKIPDNLPQTQDMPVRITVQAPTEGTTPAKRTPEEEARDILAAAAKNQIESGPGTRRAAVRACKYLHTRQSIWFNYRQRPLTSSASHSAQQRSGGTWQMVPAHRRGTAGHCPRTYI